MVVDDQALADHESTPHHPRPWVRQLGRAKDRLLDGKPPTLTRTEQVLHSVDSLAADGIAIRPVARSEAHELLLPAGHPLDGTVYVGDPVDGRRYHLMADFHVRTFEAKVADAIELLGNLGARRIDVTSTEAGGREVNGDLRFPVNVTKMKVTGGMKQRASRRLQFQAELEPTGLRDPSDIPWLPYEDLWQSIVDLRLNSGLKHFNLTVATDNDLQITADASARISKAQLGLGGKFRQWRKTTWVMTGEFGPMPQRGLFDRRPT